MTQQIGRIWKEIKESEIFGECDSVYKPLKHERTEVYWVEVYGNARMSIVSYGSESERRRLYRALVINTL